MFYYNNIYHFIQVIPCVPKDLTHCLTDILLFFKLLIGSEGYLFVEGVPPPSKEKSPLDKYNQSIFQLFLLKPKLKKYTLK